MNRGKRILTLALNQQLAGAITNFKQQAPTKQRVRRISYSDSDYIPIKSSGVSSCSSYSNCENSESTPNRKSSKVNIISNIILIPKPIEKQNEADAYLAQNNESSSQQANLITDSNSIAIEILNEVVDKVFILTSTSLYTKKGELRKRKKHHLTVSERKHLKQDELKLKHCVKSLCSTNCKRKCRQQINAERQNDINKQFWSMNKTDRSNYMLSNVSEIATKRNTTGRPDSRRSRTYLYSFKDEHGQKQDVCRKFYLAILGYDTTNDKTLRNVLTKTNQQALIAHPDKRGSKNSNRKVNRDVLINHIQSFNPTIAHYRREHAPRRLYLPSDLSITSMYEDFKKKNPIYEISYYLYRSVLNSLNISFAKLSNEECWQCEKFALHGKNTGHKKDSLDVNYDECTTFNIHWKKYTEARMLYQNDGNNQDPDKLVVSADLEKVIMLPRCDTFKEVIFTPRIIAYNESFVVTGKSKVPTAVIWHEGISGRSKQDIASTFYAFFLSVRDTKNLILWLDNCSSQNKNWNLYSFFIYIMNSSEVAFETLTVKYFEPGHSFMAADWFHHQVERSLKVQGKVYDFQDFSDAVKNSVSKVNVIRMEIQDFYNWEDCTSQYKLRKINPRPYLNKMVEITFLKGKKTMWYKTNFNDASIELNFLGAKYAKQGINKPEHRLSCRGITQERKNAIISKLCTIMPENRIKFWEHLSVSQATPDGNYCEEEDE